MFKFPLWYMVHELLNPWMAVGLWSDGHASRHRQNEPENRQPGGQTVKQRQTRVQEQYAVRNREERYRGAVHRGAEAHRHGRGKAQ